MDGDGTKAGYDLALTRAISDAVGVPVIASGGAGTLEHFREALDEGGADAALVMLKLKLQYFGHLMRRADSFEKTLMQEEKGTTEDEMVGWHH